MSELTKLNWNEVFELPALSFLVYISFWNYKVRKEEQQLEQFRRKNGKR